MTKRSVRLAALSVAVLLVAAACSSGGDSSSSSESSGGGGSTEVTVALNEFDVELSQTEFEAGVEYTFTVTNVGAVPHEMMFIAPPEGDEKPSMEELDEMAVAVFSAEDLTAGATVTQKVTFPSSGTSVLEAACFVPGHYEAGMKTPITVTG